MVHILPLQLKKSSSERLLELSRVTQRNGKSRDQNPGLSTFRAVVLLVLSPKRKERNLTQDKKKVALGIPGEAQGGTFGTQAKIMLQVND